MAIALGDRPYSGPTAALTDVWRALRAACVRLAGDYRDQEEKRGHG